MSRIDLPIPDNTRGCTAPGCGSQDTEHLSPFVGRRCALHPPAFDLNTAVAVAATDPASALAYIRTFAAEDAA